MSVEQKLVDIIAEKLSVDKEKVVPAASFVDDLGADSLDLVELLMEFEGQFGGEISDEEALRIKTVGDVVRYIEAQVTAKD